ncbi:MAG: glycoside hydrolase family 16 protein [Ruminococcaceae bacterium]|nr:glycoside hydrolase family 16 protein [Oscillospiraceae bacterium]
MKKHPILLALLLAATLTACGGKDTPASDTTAQISTTTAEGAASTEETTAKAEETTEEETVPMIEVTPEAIVDARLTVDAYRAALTETLSAANLSYTLTTDGSETGFDAVVLSTMEKKSYVVNVTDDAILVRAGHYLSLEAALKEIIGGKGLDGQSFAGEYTGDIPLSMDEMVLVWNEEFDGDTLDPAKWTLKAKMNQGDILNSTDEKNVKVTDGNLLLRSWREDDGAERPYSTNTSVTTDGTFSYKYGYLEMSAIVPYEKGAWPSFWLLGSDLHKVSDYRAEVDVLEGIGRSYKGISCLHKSTISPEIGGWVNYSVDSIISEEERDYRFTRDQIANLKTEYHRHGFGWTPTQVYFTLDGEVYFTYDITEAGNFGEGDMSCFQDPLFIIFNNFLFTDKSAWQPSMVSTDTEFPIEYRIDWVRLYQTPGEGELHYDIYR